MALRQHDIRGLVEALQHPLRTVGAAAGSGLLSEAARRRQYGEGVAAAGERARGSSRALLTTMLRPSFVITDTISAVSGAAGVRHSAAAALEARGGRGREGQRRWEGAARTVHVCAQPSVDGLSHGFASLALSREPALRAGEREEEAAPASGQRRSRPAGGAPPSTMGGALPPLLFFAVASPWSTVQLSNPPVRPRSPRSLV